MICPFDSHRVSKLSQLAAKDYEDLLQCAIPAFEGLFPELDNPLIISVLYTLALFHCLGKMQVHGTDTLELLDEVTTWLGDVMQRFQGETCVKYSMPTPNDTSCDTNFQQSCNKESLQAGVSGALRALGQAASVPTTFSLRTPKWHFMGDYTACIRRLGTTDNFSTEPVRPFPCVK
ncbi:hypothetical protein DACRYDRAFT_44232 [Dacryopinax primogenitus]|uniref:Uncharacterized protein n=1 Tax=Dacryopinax primogenitus (strain DJM 731) TaxID=1858805 RepID=M5GCD5_DACPD|nr:uncharacterized protein DACRYDRAFT_44232 [Dacryopinax primogenitus]EJU06165.1 hypothetical protein DACRYDRAFT_44232 [Dacryopinax primogenitus]